MDDISHSTHSFVSLAPLLTIFAIAGLIVPFLQRYHISPILGYLLCGLLVGPFGLPSLSNAFPVLSGIAISHPASVKLIGEIGIIFLMFMIGLELSLHRLMEMKTMVLGMGSTQIIVCSLFIAAFVSIFGNAPQVSILVGISFALSSTAIVMQILKEQHLTNRSVGIASFSILLMQDLAVVPLLVILGGLTTSTPDSSLPFVLFKSMAIAIIVVVMMYFVGLKILRPVLGFLSLTKNPEWLLSLAIFLVIGCAVTTEISGLSAALGAFLAGLLIAETDFKHEIEVIIEPLKSLLLGIFFLSVGMQIDVREIASNPFWLPASVIGLFIIKTACIYVVARKFHIQKPVALDLGVRLAQAGEFAFLILGLSVTMGIIPSKDGQFFLLVASISIFTTPLFTKLSPFLQKHLNLNQSPTKPSTDISISAVDDPVILIAGYGRVGRLLGNALEHQRIPYIAIENSFEKVKLLKEHGHRVIFADARKIDIWRKLHLDSVKLIVIAIDNPEYSEQILKSLRAEWPLIPIIVRTHDTEQMERLYDLGATKAIPEILEASMTVTKETLSIIGYRESDIGDEIEISRRNALLKHSDV